MATTSLFLPAASSPSSTLITSILRSAVLPTPATASPSSSTARATAEPDPGLFPLAGSSTTASDAEEERRENVFNFYFLILAAFGIIVVLFLYFLRQKRLRQKARLRRTGQTALARDLDGWAGSRRWTQGNRRPGQTASAGRREEGLNENGEAPPPYEPKSDTAVVVDERTGMPRDLESGLAVPTRTLLRDEIETIRPPEYQEVTRTSVDAGSGSPPATPAPPPIAHAHPDSAQSNQLRRTTSGAND